MADTKENNKNENIKAALEEESCFICELGKEATKAAAIGAGVIAGIYAAKKIINILEGSDNDNTVAVEME